MSIGIFATVVCILGALIIVLLVFPQKLVAVLGKFYRRAYKTFHKMSDDELDSISQLPADRYLIGRRSEFIRYAPEEPQRFTRLIIAYRIAGLILLLFWCICVVGILCFILAPEYWTTN